ncbi:PA-phosphatase-like phosphoesterase [Mycobacteroides abscessus subsp. abscessus]|uniref:phosphatase PAP2 family protein n=1 Tax=uncultured Rothia sp. TaxID=316088 RepID=UPI00092C25D4|nr:PA-phosphatase-like phosphoesterase [Mycobacteroides abscessus subsp. abscessus]
MIHRTGEQPNNQLSTSPANAWKSTTIENSTHAPVSVVEPENEERPSPLGQLSPKNIRRTRPTFWALMQHIFAIFLLSFMLLVAVGFYIQIPVGQQLDEISFNEFSYQFLGLQNQTLQLLDLIPAIAGVLAVVGIIFVLLWKHRFVPALVGLGVALCANISAQVLKNLVISKPNFGIQEAALNSAPSGHTTFAAAAAAALFIASPKKLRPAVALLGAVISFAAGFSTIINGWHRPADVITAIILTSIWTVIGLTILRFLRSEELDLSNTQRTGLILIPLLSISGFFLGFCSLALYLVTFYDPIPGGALMAAICMILAVLAFTTSLQIGLLRARNKQRSAYTKIWTY